jgi:hypothetical protein
MHITAYYDAERRRDMEMRAEASRIVRAARRRRSMWAWLHPSFLASRPDLVPAPPHSDLAPAPPLPDLAPAPPEPDLAATRPQKDPAATRPLPALEPTPPLPALSGAAADHASAGA